MKHDEAQVKKNKSGLFEMKFVKKAKSFSDFVSTADKLAKPGTLKNTPAKDTVTMKDTSKHELKEVGAPAN